MEEKKGEPGTVDEYIARFPEDVQQVLVKIRAVVKESAPEAVEKISYQMPGYYQNGFLVSFAVWKHHIGFYPRVASTDEALKKELSKYEGTKGSFHFPLDQLVPYELIGKIVKLRVAKNMEK